MVRQLLTKLWTDDCGAVIATEYLMLGTVVGLGGVTGLASMRDAMNGEYKEFGNTIRDVRHDYKVPSQSGAAGTRGGTVVVNEGLYSLTATP